MSSTLAPPAPLPQSASTSRDAWGRLTRLALKELKEVLRDRRTILTLVLMPVLLYPLLSLLARQYLLASRVHQGPATITIGVLSEEDRILLLKFLRVGDQWLTEHPAEGEQEPAPTLLAVPNEESGGSPRKIDVQVVTDPHEALRAYVVNVAVRIDPGATPQPNPNRGDIVADGTLEYLEGSVSGKVAVDYVQSLLDAANTNILDTRLRRLGVSQRAVPFQSRRVVVSDPEYAGTVSLLTVAPLILILMTITGAVYPAIDLTAGERERGTLEVLVAAPVPRLGLLLAKYVAVVAVACLTAGINLTMMILTVVVGGLGPVVFGEAGLSAVTVLQVLALMLLFSAFFSAILLAVASFARSFKEAQAYLVPLMLAALAPGVASILPGLSLDGPLSVTPLVNIVLLARDVFERHVSPVSAAIVVTSTLLYAMGAIGLAAKFFGAEAVLYSGQSGWSNLLDRPRESVAVAPLPGALLCLALLFPCHFTLVNLIARVGGLPIGQRLMLAGVATALLFGLIPAIAAWRGRVRAKSGFALALPRVWVWLPALLMGLSLWPIAHEVMVWQIALGWTGVSNERLADVSHMLNEWRQVRLILVVLCMAVLPAVFEELFFRGFLQGALAARLRPVIAVVVSSILFGLFHLVASDALTVERLLPSTLLGLVLGFVRLWTKSVLPGMLIHSVHNGLLVASAHQLDQLPSLIEWLHSHGGGWLARPLEAMNQLNAQSGGLVHLPSPVVVSLSLVALVSLALLFWMRLSRPGDELPADGSA